MLKIIKVFFNLALVCLLASCSFSMVGDVTPPLLTPQAQPNPAPLSGDLFVERAHVFLSAETPGKLQVEEMLAVTNQGSQPSRTQLTIELPPGAQNMQFQQDGPSGRFQSTPNGFIDTQEIPVGSNQPPIIFSYEMPYSGDLDLSLKFPLAVKAVLVTSPGGDLQISGSQLQDMGEQTMQGTRFHIYGVGALPGGESLRIRVSSSSASWLVDSSGSTSLVVGLAAFLLTLGFIFWRMKKQ